MCVQCDVRVVELEGIYLNIVVIVICVVLVLCCPF